MQTHNIYYHFSVLMMYVLERINIIPMLNGNGLFSDIAFLLLRPPGRKSDNQTAETQEEGNGQVDECYPMFVDHLHVYQLHS